VWRQDRVDRWDLAKLEKTTAVKYPFFGSFRRMRMRGDGSLFAIHLQPGGVAFWDPATEKEVGRLEDAKLIADDGMDFTPDGRQLFVWERGSGQPVRAIELPIEPVTGLAADPAGHFAVVSSTSLLPRKCDLATGQVIGDFALPPVTLVNTNGLAVTGDGRTL